MKAMKVYASQKYLPHTSDDDRFADLPLPITLIVRSWDFKLYILSGH